jgi:two-component sensor histidine kinase
MGRKASLLSLVALIAALTGIELIYVEIDPLFATARLALLGLMAAALWRWPRAAPSSILDQIAGLEREAREKEFALAKLIGEHAAVIREIHHRVKNNLQIVYSLLDLQVGRLNSPEAREALAATRARISALALLHRHLYDDHDFHSVEMRPFVEDLCVHLNMLEDGRSSERVAITVSVDSGRLISDQAVGVGQIITEAALNARQHAFPGDRRGTIQVSLRMTDADATLIIADDGLGLSTAAGAPAASGVGSALIHSFAKQIGGSADITNGAGAVVTVHFKPQFASN